MGLSVVAILLAIALVVGLLAWTRRELRARGASPRAWWLIVACYALATVAWLVALLVPLPVVLAWLATIPAAVATLVPERVAALVGGEPPRRRRTRPIAAARNVPHQPMARRIGTRRRPTTDRPASDEVAPSPASSTALTTRHPAEDLLAADQRESPTTDARPTASPSLGTEPGTVSSPAQGPRRVTLGLPSRSMPQRRGTADLRLAVELLREAARLPDLDEDARGRIEARLVRLDRFRHRDTIELLALVRDDVHASLGVGPPAMDGADVDRHIRALLDILDPPTFEQGTERRDLRADPSAELDG